MDSAQRESLRRTLDIAWKDLDCVLEAAGELGLALPGAALARQELEGVLFGGA
jgi:3-hydroxyisobutyrate dehydrogenase-like beta-hydroxyacid dehydrogenase